MRIRSTASPVAVIAASDLRAEPNDDANSPGTIGGYGIRFEEIAGPWRLMFGGELYEIISRDATITHFRNNAQVYWQHKSDQILGSEATGRATFRRDSQGYFYQARMIDTGYARDAYTAIEAGEVRDSSFGFDVPTGGEEILTAQESGIQELIDREGEAGWVLLARVNEIILHETSPVSRGAYAGASVGVRADDEQESRCRAFLESRGEKQQAARARQLAFAQRRRLALR